MTETGGKCCGEGGAGKKQCGEDGCVHNERCVIVKVKSELSWNVNRTRVFCRDKTRFHVLLVRLQLVRVSFLPKAI
jgi:hypothetical protein